MNKYLKIFLLRGLMFGGFGPIIIGIVYIILQNTVKDFSLNGAEVCLAIISTYILAFIQAGATVFNQIESWSVPKSLLCHFATLFAAYSICYTVNSWIPFKLSVLVIFAIIFIVIYFIVWITVYLTVKSVSNKMNERLKNS